MRRLVDSLATGLALGLVGCGGSGGAPEPTTPAQPPPAADLVHREYLGPVHEAYTLPGAAGCSHRCVESLSIDGIPTTPTPFNTLGKVVRSRSTRPNHYAVDVQHAVIGPITAIDLSQDTLTVLGQTVYVLDQTWTNVPGLTSLLSVGDFVAVSGSFTAAGDIYSTHLSRAEPGALLVRGILAAGNGGAARIGALEVDLSAATLEGFPASAPLPGDAVLLRASAPWSGGRLAVQTARLTSGDWKVDASASESKALVGFVTAARSPTDFDVAGYRVDLGACGCPALETAPAVGTPVRIGRGPFNTPGAASLNLLTWRSTIIVGPIESIDLTRGTLRVLGTTAHVLPATYIVSNAVAGWELPTPEENLSMPLWEPGLLPDFRVGEQVAVIGGARDERLVAGGILRVAGAYGPSIMTSQRVIAEDRIRFLGQDILADPHTRISNCSYGPCQAQSLEWFFRLPPNQYFPPILGITLESATPPLRAQTIDVRLQD